MEPLDLVVAQLQPKGRNEIVLGLPQDPGMQVEVQVVLRFLVVLAQ